MALAHELDMQVIAEGVETPEQLAQLSAIGYTLIQGYHFAKPMVERDLIAWLQVRESTHPFRS